jgi:thiol-disulfide isomerase/thioredoxin
MALPTLFPFTPHNTPLTPSTSLFIRSLSLLSSPCYRSTVVELTPDNFDALTSEGDWLVEFYAPWCIHCQRMAPHLQTAAAQLSGTVHVGKIDGPAWRSLTFRFGVNGFPTFFHVHNEGSGPFASREVRRISVASSIEGVKHAATQGWRGREPLPWAAGPYGPLAQLKYYGLAVGERLFKLHEPVAEMLGVPSVFTGFLMGILLLAGFTGLLIGCAVWIGPRKRRGDEEEEHEE